jgi:hypothetical protein
MRLVSGEQMLGSLVMAPRAQAPRLLQLSVATHAKLVRRRRCRIRRLREATLGGPNLKAA